MSSAFVTLTDITDLCFINEESTCFVYCCSERVKAQ